MNHPCTLRVAFLVGSDSHSTRLCVESVCALHNIEPVAVLLDTEHPGVLRRLKNLRKNLRKEGWKYVIIRVIEAVRSFIELFLSNTVVSRNEVRRLLRKAFPDR